MFNNHKFNKFLYLRRIIDYYYVNDSYNILELYKIGIQNSPLIQNVNFWMLNIFYNSLNT